MNERLTIQDLTDLLAAKHSMTKKDAEAFVKEFFLLIEQALESEQTVKIKGLGTFKLIDVDSRESVNVNTGERFKIKGHTKVSFSPDANLRDTINKPFAHFETVVLNENTILDDTPVEETEDEETGEEIPVQTLADEPVIQSESIEQQPQKVQEETNIETDCGENVVQPEEEGALQEVPLVEQQLDPIEDKEEITAEKIIEQELLKANLKPEVPIISPKKEVVKSAKPTQAAMQPTSKKKAPAKEKSPIPYLITVIILVLLLCGGVILFIYYPDLFSSSSDKNVLEMPPVTSHPVQPEMQLSDTIAHKDTIKEVKPDIPKTVVTPQPVAKKEEITPSAKSENKVVQQQPQASAYLDSTSYKITGTKTKYTVKEGETLTRVSLRFYGTKAMWPYIVKHNPDVIKNPNNVPYGTTIKIPELTKE